MDMCCLHTILPQQIVEEIIVVQVPSLNSALDTLRWIHAPNGRYTPTLVYHSLTGIAL